jgi:segregation and condensation protein B
MTNQSAPVGKTGVRRKAVAAGQPDAAAQPSAGANPERDDHLLGSVEAVLLSVDRPVAAARLAEAIFGEEAGEGGGGGEDQAEEAEAPIVAAARGKAATPGARIRAAVAALNEEYERTGRAFRIESVAGGFRIMTLPRFAGVIEQFLGRRERTALSRPAVETLAIIAYRQPVTRASLEAIRGVACGEVLKTLIDRRLVTITGRAEELGRPMLYGTTKAFLEAFGLASVKDLPSVEEFRARHVGGEEDEKS